MLTVALSLALSVQPVPEIKEFCLVATVYGEARGESSLGQAMVAKTVLNRAARIEWPGNVCSVVTDKNQYTGYGASWPKTPEDLLVWQRITRVVQSVLGGNFEPGECGLATHFHSADVAPWWSKKLKYLCRIDKHLFYVED